MSESLRKEVLLPADRETVWDALTRDALLSEWLAEEVELDVREGGEGVLRYAGGEERAAVVDAVDEGERLVLRWTRAGSAETRVEFELVDAVAGTRLVVTEAPAVGPTAWTAPLASLRAVAGALCAA
jgi:uncharacterized protein YndB with AHSA1/START domain